LPAQRVPDVLPRPGRAADDRRARRRQRPVRDRLPAHRLVVADLARGRHRDDRPPRRGRRPQDHGGERPPVVPGRGHGMAPGATSMEFSDPTTGPTEPTRYWTTANIGEATPDVLSPMCWSFWGPQAEVSARRSYWRFGILAKREVTVPADPNELMTNYF